MARVTVEDCILQIPNRFDLVMIAAERARAISSGALLQVDRDRDKNPVVALREIADRKLELPALQESLIKGLQRRIEPDRPEEEVVELMVGEQQPWMAGTGEGEDLGDFDEEEAEDGTDAAAAGEAGGSFEDADIKD